MTCENLGPSTKSLFSVESLDDMAKMLRGKTRALTSHSTLPALHTISRCFNELNSRVVVRRMQVHSELSLELVYQYRSVPATYR